MSLVIMLRDGEELVLHASAGHATDMRGVRLPIAGSTSGQVLQRRKAERITDVDARLRPAWITGIWAIGLVLSAWDAYFRAPITETDVRREIERLHPQQ